VILKVDRTDTLKHRDMIMSALIVLMKQLEESI